MWGDLLQKMIRSAGVEKMVIDVKYIPQTKGERREREREREILSWLKDTDFSFLQDLLKHTPKNHQDYDQLHKAQILAQHNLENFSSSFGVPKTKVCTKTFCFHIPRQ